MDVPIIISYMCGNFERGCCKGCYVWGRGIETTYSEGAIKKASGLVSGIKEPDLLHGCSVYQRSPGDAEGGTLSVRAGRNTSVYLWLQFSFPFSLSSRYLNKAFHIWSKKDKFSSTFINSVISHTDTERSAPAWMLLSKITCSSPKLDYTKIMESWEKLSRFACLQSIRWPTS